MRDFWDPKSGAVVHDVEEFYFVHSVNVCQKDGPRRCVIHAPTNHHMRSWTVLFRADRSMLCERLCEHGVGHPDPDDIEWRPESEAAGVHGCDGCCHPPHQKEKTSEVLHKGRARTCQ